MPDPTWLRQDSWQIPTFVNGSLASNGPGRTGPCAALLATPPKLAGIGGRARGGMRAHG